MASDSSTVGVRDGGEALAGRFLKFAVGVLFLVHQLLELRPQRLVGAESPRLAGAHEGGQPKRACLVWLACIVAFLTIGVRPPVLAVEAPQERRDTGAIEAEGLMPTRVDGPASTVERGRLDLSGGAQLLFPATGPGDALELDLPAAAGYWQLVARVSLGPDCGDLQAFGPDGKTALGPVVRLWAAQPGLTRRLLGTLMAREGPNHIRLQVAGKADQSTGCRVGIDWLCWRPMVAPGAIEGEDLRVLVANGGTAGSEDVAPPTGPWSGGAHLRFACDTRWGQMEVEVPVSGDGAWPVVAYFTRSPDGGIVQAAIDDQPLGEKVDLYAPEVRPSGKVVLGRQKLGPGTHRLRFTMVDKNPASRGYSLGLDCLVAGTNRAGLWSRFTAQAKRVVFFGQEEAAALGENRVSPEHLLLGLLRDGDSPACRVLARLGTTAQHLRDRLLEQVPRGPGRTAQSITLDERSRVILDGVNDQAEQQGDRWIGTEHFLLAFLQDSESLARRVLHEAGVTPDGVALELPQALAQPPVGKY